MMARHRKGRTMTTIQDRARGYVAKMPPPISGQGGHLATYNAALALVKGFALDEAAAADVLSEWNQSHCEPPWSTSELRHKIQSAARSDRETGYLLKSSEKFPDARATSFPPPDKVAQRRAWPAFSRLTRTDIDAIAALRGLPADAVDLCARAGFIRTAVVEGHRSFIIAEHHFAQARRLDGQPFTLRDGKTTKAKNLPGSAGAFIGQKWLGKMPPILLVEGAIGLVEATAALLIAGHTNWTALAATSASSRFHRDPALLAKLAHRRVRIVPDPDDAGLDGAATWLAAMEDAGATVDAVALPAGCKDLGDLLTQPASHARTLRELFTL